MEPTKQQHILFCLVVILSTWKLIKVIFAQKLCICKYVFKKQLVNEDTP